MRNPLIASCAAVLLAASAGFAQAPKPPAPGFYALYCWSEGYLEYAQDVQKVGIRWLRIGDWTGSAQDEKALLLATANGVRFVPVLAVDTGKTIQADAAVENFRQAVRAAVQRYGPGGTFWKEHPEAEAGGAIRYWEIWNEPNIEFLIPPDDPNGMLRTQLYAPLLKTATEEIHKLDPGAVVIGFNVAGGASVESGPPADDMFHRLKYIGWRKFIKDVTALAGPDSFDAVGLHPYTSLSARRRAAWSPASICSRRRPAKASSRTSRSGSPRSASRSITRGTSRCATSASRRASRRASSPSRPRTA